MSLPTLTTQFSATGGNDSHSPVHAYMGHFMGKSSFYTSWVGYGMEHFCAYKFQLKKQQEVFFRHMNSFIFSFTY